MTRIIAGAIGSIKLKPAAKATRPTSDRVKESIFGRLEAGNQIDGSSVLDLFAGTGALGLEAISRGARSAVFVEQDKPAAGLLQQNLDMARKGLSVQGLEVDLTAVNRSAERFLATNASLFDLVFVDPPYELSETKLRDLLAELTKHLNQGAMVVVERSSKSSILLPEQLEKLGIKAYGDTQVAFCRFA